MVVCYTGALRDDSKNGCVADYMYGGFVLLDHPLLPEPLLITNVSNYVRY